MKRFIIAIIIATLTPVFGDFNPEDFRHREIKAHYLKTPLILDGELSEDLYSNPSATDFIQFVPNNGVRGSQKTEMWVGYDDEALYVGARMWDTSPDSIVTRIGRRDEYLSSDLFEVIIDSYHDKRTGYSFQINPSGAIRDEAYFNDSWTDLSWDAIWEGKTKIDEKGWTAELRIPYSQLRFDEKEVYTWGIFPTRYIQRYGEWDYFMYKPLEESGAMSRASLLTGIEGIKPPKRFSMLPYITSSVSDLPSQEKNIFTNGKTSNMGIGADIKAGIGGNLTVDATINPDFGQVEVDPSSINLSAYETYYDEKRPFFVEGRSIFRFGNSGPTNNWGFNWSGPSFFYSRRIGRAPQGYIGAHPDSLDKPESTRILGAMKVSGKVQEDWSIGMLSVLTSREYGEYYTDGDKEKQEIEPLTSYNVVRAQREINDGRQGIGFIGTLTERNLPDNGDGYLDYILSERAVTIGADGWNFFGKDRTWALGVWGGFSNVSGSKDRITSLQKNPQHYFQRPDADHLEVDTSATDLKGFAGRISLNKEQGNFRFNTALGVISPGFETNDLGLTWSTDRINHHVVFGYQWTEPGKIFNRINLDFAYQTNHDFSGVKNGEQIIGMGWVRFNNHYGINYFIDYVPENISSRTLRGGPSVLNPAGKVFEIGMNSDSRKDITFRSYVNINDDEGGSRSERFGIGTELNLGHQMNISIGSSYSKNLQMDQYVGSFNNPFSNAMYGKRYVVGKMLQRTFEANVRVSYTFTPKLTFQAFVQPFVSVGEYTRFKEYKEPGKYSFYEYDETEVSVNYDDENESKYYVIDPAGNGSDDEFYISPDFSWKSFVGTAVLRWEFKPGSTAFLVWTFNRFNNDRPGQYDLGRDLNDVLSAESDDFLALKITYWFGK